MDKIDQETVSNISQYLGGGWASVIVTVLVGIGFAYLRHKAKEAKLAGTNKVTDQTAIEAKVEAKESNPEKQAKWDEAINDIDEIRKQARQGASNDKDSK